MEHPALGPVAAFLGFTDSTPAAELQRVAVRRVEDAGYSALWTNEIVGTDALVRAALWLGWVDHLTVGTCIANMWARPAATAYAAASALADAFPDRFVLGLGVGYPAQAASVGREFGTPLSTARDYLAQQPGPQCPRILAANGPKMLSLAGELCDGALPAGQEPAATARAREVLGSDKLLVVYRPIADSDGAASVAESVAAHLEAGADQVIIGRPAGADPAAAVAMLEQLAPALHLTGR